MPCTNPEVGLLDFGRRRVPLHAEDLVGVFRRRMHSRRVEPPLYQLATTVPSVQRELTDGPGLPSEHDGRFEAEPKRVVTQVAR